MNLSYEVPKFETFEFSKKRHKYCVCIFIINEGEKFLKQLNEMAFLSQQVDIVVADGDSSDGSTSHNLLINCNVNTLLVKKSPGKLGSQMRMAYSWALKRGYDGVINIDGNGKDSITNVPDFIFKLDQGYDHIQGSRFIPGGYHMNTPVLRLLALKLIHIPLIRVASAFKYTDTTNGFRAYSSNILLNPRIDIFRDVFDNYALHYYLAVKAPKLNLRCIEIPVTRKYPNKGKTPTKISFFYGNISILKELIKVVIGRYDPRS